MKLFAVLIGIALSGAALAQTYPTKPIRMFVPFPAASIPDLVARQVAEKISAPLGQPVLVENRVGAGGRIAATAGAKAAPDGYTLLLGSATTHVVAPHVVKSMPYDSVRDFTPICNAASSATGVAVHASLPVHSIRELVEYARKNPGKIAFASNGIGSTHHIRGELMKTAAGIDMIHVPFGGSNELVTALISGTVQMAFITPGAIRQFIQAGKVRHIAMATPKRYAATPDIPTVAEEMPGYEPIQDWFAFFGPAGLARPIVTRLNGEMVKALHMADVRAALENVSLQVIASSPEELAETIQRELPVYARAVKAAGIKPE